MNKATTNDEVLLSRLEKLSIVKVTRDALSLSVLAEYVETEEYREELHEIGCDCYQGYLYSKAMPLDDK